MVERPPAPRFRRPEPVTTPVEPVPDPRRSRRRLGKVPALTVWFWVAKLLTTAMGEATSDYLVGRFDPVVVVVAGFLAMAAVLAVQLTRRRYVATVYWATALMVSVFGTMAADVVHVRLGVPYGASTLACALALAATFVAWQRTEGTISIHRVDSVRRELFYWAAAVLTFALGTATGDLTAVTFHLGYLSSGLLFAAVFAVPAIGFWRFRMNGILAFWSAYVVTRPLGASFADWVAKPRDAKGLGHGDGIVALVLGVGLLACTLYVAVSGVDDPAIAEVAAVRR